MGCKHEHFGERDAIGHVVEAQVRGIVDAAEIHGTEIPGHLSAASDAVKECALLLLLTTLLGAAALPLALFGAALVVWKGGRSAWLAWARLERLHRILTQEKWEIDHHRDQEREELKALYRAKGFEGKLLDEVIDVLMADGDRLLKVMIEEELGLTLGKQEHPLKQAFYVLGAATITVATVVAASLLLPLSGVAGVTLGLVALASAFAATYEGNDAIDAVVWNCGLAILASSVLHFTLQYVKGGP